MIDDFINNIILNLFNKFSNNTTIITDKTYYNYIKKNGFILTEKEVTDLLISKFNSTNIDFELFKNNIILDLNIDGIPIYPYPHKSFITFTEDNEYIIDEDFINLYISNELGSEYIESFKDMLKKLANVTSLSEINYDKYLTILDLIFKSF